jgi:hypothetical protein
MYKIREVSSYRRALLLASTAASVGLAAYLREEYHRNEKRQSAHAPSCTTMVVYQPPVSLLDKTAHLARQAAVQAKQVLDAPISAARTIRNWWINRSASRRAKREAGRMLKKMRNRRRTRFDWEEQGDVGLALGDETQVRDVRRRRTFRRGERVDEIVFSHLNKFGPLKPTELNRKLIRTETLRHDLYNHSSIREKAKYRLMQSVLFQYFVITDSDMVEAFLLLDSSNLRRADQLSGQA